MQADTTIYYSPANGATRRFHAIEDCPRLANSETVRESEYRNRPLRSTPCAYCQDEFEESTPVVTDGGRVQPSERTCARCEADALPGSRFCFGHSRIQSDD